VPSAYDRAALLPQTFPAPVPAPAPPARAPLAYRSPAPDQRPASTASAEFLAALLTGTGDVDRYVTPGTRVQAITPAPYAQVRLQRVQVDADPADLPDVPGNGDQLHALVTAEATSAAGQALSVQYALTLTAREGRWEVQSVDPAPREAQPSPAAAAPPTSTTAPPTRPLTAAPTTSTGTPPTR